jgi:beta-lactamase regulating signal transducer with metallopeptidase domain/tetratricopeptide (TPR) repeat protein
LREIVLFSPQGDLDAMIEEQFARDRVQLDRIAAGQVAIPSLDAEDAPLAATVGQVQPTQGAPAAQKAGWSLASLLLGLWGIGVLVMVGIIALDMLKLRHLHRRGSDAPEFLHEMADAIARDIGLRRTPQLRIIAGLDSPALVGTLRPTVFLPAWLAGESNAEQAAWLLRHELMHARHGDSIALLLRRAAESLFFFHPVVWFAGRQWEEATELACDRALIADNDQARDYARQLLDVLETRHVQRPMAMSPGLFATRTQIGRRIAALLANPLQNPARLSVAALAIILVGGVAAVSVGLEISKDLPAIQQQEGGVAPEGEPAPKMEWVAPATREGLNTARVKSLHSRAQADLRTMHVALESYRVDWGVIPESKWFLTTPIAYMTAIPKDPFVPFALQPKDPATGEMFPYPGEDTYTLEVSPDFTQLFVYSIGPDGRDDKAAVAFDPANGTVSGGDVIRTVELGEYITFGDDALDPVLYQSGSLPGNLTPLGSSPGNLTLRVRDQHARLESAVQTIRFWAMNNNRLPASWEEVIATEGEFAPPVDLFSKDGQPVRYILSENRGVVYSVGPDGDDDGGLRIPNGRYSATNPPDGDLVQAVEWEEVKKFIEQRENPASAAEEDAFLKAILAQKEQAGRDNALVYYQMASLTWPGLPMGEINGELDRLRQPGERWTVESHQMLPYLKAWEQSFAKIREGAALDYAENVDPSLEGPATKVPNFLFAQVSSKSLVAQGKYFESKGEYDRALDNYLTVLRMGRDYGSKNTVLIGSLISIAVQSIGQNALGQLVTSGKLSEAQLQRAAQELSHIASTYPGIAEGFRGERLVGEAGIAQMTQKLREMSDQEFARQRIKLQQEAGMSGLVSFVVGTREGMINWLENGAKELSEFFVLVEAEVAKPPYEQQPQEFLQEQVVGGIKHPMAKIALPNFVEAATRYYVMQSKRGIAQTQIALERYRRYHSRYPEKLGQLEGTWIDKLPVDPFSGGEYEYHSFDDGTKYVLYGLGPERRDHPEAVSYDPTNGTVSAGVLF